MVSVFILVPVQYKIINTSTDEKNKKYVTLSGKNLKGKNIWNNYMHIKYFRN